MTEINQKKGDGKKFVTLFSGLLDLLFPPQCQICGGNLVFASSRFVCNDCMDRVPFIHSPLCVICGRQHEISTIAEDRCCGDCLKHRPVFDSARSVVGYEQPVVELLHRLKYKKDTSVSGSFREIMAATEMMASVPVCDLIVPVPLYRARLRKRGLNQSLVLATFFPGGKDKIVRDLLVRVKDTSPQTGLNGIERRRNLKGAFAVNQEVPVKGKKILLVDDVFTTGTTVSECSKTLKKIGLFRSARMDFCQSLSDIVISVLLDFF